MNRFLNIISRIAACICLLLVSSCSHEKEGYALPEFKSTRKISFELMSGPLPYGGVSRIHLAGNYLVIDAYDITTKKYCHVYRKYDCKCVAEAMALGRGPKELIGMHHSQSDGSRCCFTDVMRKVTLSFIPDSLVTNGIKAISMKFANIPSWEKTGLYVGDERISLSIKSTRATVDTAGVVRFRLYDENGAFVNSSNMYPESDMKKNWQNSYSMASSPDKTKFAVASFWSGVLELYDYPSLSTRNILYLVPPMFNSESDGLALTEDSKACFSSIICTDKYVYTVFDGVNSVMKTPRADRNHNIDIYDWDGRPVKRIITNYSIESIAVSESENMIYALVTDSNGELYIARLTLSHLS